MAFSISFPSKASYVCIGPCHRFVRGGARTCAHILGDICCVGEAYRIYSGIMSHFFIYAEVLLYKNYVNIHFILIIILLND